MAAILIEDELLDNINAHLAEFKHKNTKDVLFAEKIFGYIIEGAKICKLLLSQ